MSNMKQAPGGDAKPLPNNFSAKSPLQDKAPMGAADPVDSEKRKGPGQK
jgi:hypothetical protein